MSKHSPPPQSPKDVEPVNLREALEERYLAYALVDDHASGVARCARRIEAGPSPAPLCDVAIAARSRRRLQEIGEDRRRCHGFLSPAWRCGDLRRIGAPRAGLLLALPARRGAGQFRQYRRRFAGRLSLHRSAADRSRAPLARRAQRRHGRFPRQLRWHAGGAVRAPRGLSQTCLANGATRTLPWAWRRPFRRTTSPNSAMRPCT